jgi:hypothetical protein
MLMLIAYEFLVKGFLGQGIGGEETTEAEVRGRALGK